MMSGSALQLMTSRDAESIAKGVLARVGKAMGAAQAIVNVRCSFSASASFALNEILDVSGQESVLVVLSVDAGKRRVLTVTDRHDEAGLSALVAEAETLGRQSGSGDDDEGAALLPQRTFTDPAIFFDATTRAGIPNFQGDVVRCVSEMTERAGLIGTGSLGIRANSLSVLNTAGFNGYTRNSGFAFSVNARTLSGRGSGWAWGGGEDYSKIDPLAITARAIDLAKRSDNPVAIEPGRYTVILEPEAVSQIVTEPILQAGTSFLSAQAADAGRTALSVFKNKKAAGNKLGLQVADRRASLVSDPRDPDVPYSPLTSNGSLMARTVWIQDGILTNLAYSAGYAARMKRTELRNPGIGKLELKGVTEGLDEMVASTRRGIWVHRFTAPAPSSELTLLMTGVTRDGTFLIENGKVTKAIKNLRFSESPFFILNKIEAFGSPVRSSDATASPRLKVRDFSFTSLSDAI